MKEIEKKQRLLEHLIAINGKEKEIAKLIINLDKLIINLDKLEVNSKRNKK